MEAQELIKKIYEIVHDAVIDSSYKMIATADSTKMTDTATFYKNCGINAIANKIETLIIEEGGLQ